MPTNKQTQLAIRVARILNRHIQDPKILDEVLEELEEVLSNDEKSVTAADQAQQ